MPQLIAPVTVIIYKQFFDSVPKDFREAAVIDGANEFQLLFRVYLPMNWGITTALAIITFIGAWNLFLWPFLAVTAEDKMNITVGITQVHDAFGVQYARDLARRHARGAAGRDRLSHLPAPGDAGHHAVGRHQGMSVGRRETGTERRCAHVELRHVTKRYGAVQAINDLSLTVDKGSFTALLGPSGCGKSTLLRMIAGLEEITAGQCFIDNTDVTDMPPAKRRIAMVFQSYALYPHMTVRQNIAFSLSIAGASRKVQDERALEVARMLQLEPFSIAGRPSFPAASASASRSAARWCASRRFSCSTSRCPTSTRSCACRCASNWRSCMPSSARR